MRRSSWAGRISPISAGCGPGSISSDTTDIFQEGIIIPPTRLIDAGTTNEAALEIFYRNSRYPETCRGDTRALMASVELGVRRIAEILARFGPDVVADAFRALFDAHPQPGPRPPARDVRRSAPTASPMRSIPTATATGRSSSASR